MRSLTEQEWGKDFVDLREIVLDEFPDVPRMDLEALRDDWDGLVALVQRSTGMSSDVIVDRLHRIDVEDDGTQRVEEAEADQRASVSQLRLGSGFSEDERPRITERLRKLDRRLRRFPADATDLRLQVKDRDTTSQQVTLEAHLPGFGTIVATSHEEELTDALMDVREDLWRRIDDAVTRRDDAR